MQRIGCVALGRGTFDTTSARERVQAAFAAMREAGLGVVGEAALQLDPDSARAAFQSVLAASPDRIVLLQATFTDAATTATLG